MTRKTPSDPVPVPEHACPAYPIKDEPRETEHPPPGERKGSAGYPADGGLRFPYCGLTLACSVYRTLDQVGDVK
jgi:hypothetical protein